MFMPILENQLVNDNKYIKNYTANRRYIKFIHYCEQRLKFLENVPKELDIIIDNIHKHPTLDLNTLAGIDNILKKLLKQHKLTKYYENISQIATLVKYKLHTYNWKQYLEEQLTNFKPTKKILYNLAEQIIDLDLETYGINKEYPFNTEALLYHLFTLKHINYKFYLNKGSYLTKYLLFDVSPQKYHNNRALIIYDRLRELNDKLQFMA